LLAKVPPLYNETETPTPAPTTPVPTTSAPTLFQEEETVANDFETCTDLTNYMYNYDYDYCQDVVVLNNDDDDAATTGVKVGPSGIFANGVQTHQNLRTSLPLSDFQTTCQYTYDSQHLSYDNGFGQQQQKQQQEHYIKTFYSVRNILGMTVTVEFDRPVKNPVLFVGVSNVVYRKRGMTIEFSTPVCPWSGLEAVDGKVLSIGTSMKYHTFSVQNADLLVAGGNNDNSAWNSDRNNNNNNNAVTTTTLMGGAMVVLGEMTSFQFTTSTSLAFFAIGSLRV